MRQGNGGTDTLTDEQILEMEPGETVGKAAAGDGSVRNSRRDDDADILGRTAETQDDRQELAARRAEVVRERGDVSGETLEQAAEEGVEKQAVQNDDGEAGEPAWVATLEAQPAAAAEARQWHAAAKDVAALDAAYFSADADARSGLAARLYESDPTAFREMLAASARTLAARDPQGLAELARELGVPVAPDAQVGPKSVSQAVRPATAGDSSRSARDGRVQTNVQAGAQAGLKDAANADASNAHDATSNATRTFPAETYRAFEATTNDDVARKMHEAIDRSLTSALPEGVVPGARRRIGDDIFREVHAALSGDRELARQVGETLRDWRFDANARQQVVALVSGRARAVLPAVAKRVVAEWTSSVLASDRAKTARIDAAATRRDITGGRLPEPVAGSARRSRDVDYRRMSDEQILDI